ncbi:hypothetical protein HUU42_08780 [bacterium]|nr:hypothetical protein [bacterium]
MRIFLDENLSEYVADALNSLNIGYFDDIPVVSTKTAIGLHEPDEKIIPTIGKEHSTLITRDFEIRRTRAQYELCKHHKVGIIFIRLPNQHQRHWELVRALIINWENVISVCRSDKLPFSYRLTEKKGLIKM